MRHATKHPQTGAAAPTVGTVLGTYEGQGRINVIGGTSGFSIIDSLTNLTTNRDESTVTAYDAAGKELARLAPGSLTGECGAADVHVPGKGRLLLTMLVSIRKAEGFTPSSHSVALQAWSASTGKQVWSATLVPWTSEEGAYMGEGECKAYDGALRGFSNTSDGRWGVELEGENGPQGGYVINLATGSVRHDPHALGAVGNAVVDEMPNPGNQEVEPNGEYKSPIFDLIDPVSGAVLGTLPGGVTHETPPALAPAGVISSQCGADAGTSINGSLLLAQLSNETPTNEGLPNECWGIDKVVAYALPEMRLVWQTPQAWEASMMGDGGHVLLVVRKDCTSSEEVCVLGVDDETGSQQWELHPVVLYGESSGIELCGITSSEAMLWVNQQRVVIDLETGRQLSYAAASGCSTILKGGIEVVDSDFNSLDAPQRVRVIQALTP